MRIGGTEIARGKRASVDIRLPRLYTHEHMSLSVHVVRGRRDGPTLLVTAALHGDEINGIEIVRRLLERKRISSLRGTLICVPVVNVFGLLRRERYLPDGRDLNRAFPGTSTGSLAGRVAHVISDEILPQADYLIDLHTGSSHRANLPQTRIAPSQEGSNIHRLAEAFGAPVILEAPLRDGSLRGAAHARGIPGIVYEAGEALRHDDISIRAGVNGILNVMAELGMVPHRSRRRIVPYLARSSRWVRATASGIVRMYARLGDRVHEGQILAVIGDPLGERSVEVTAPRDGIVIGKLRLPLVFEGEALFHLGFFAELDSVEEQLEALAELYEPQVL